MINLLPLTKKQEVQRFYKIRLGIFSLFLLLLVFIMSTIMLLPSLFLVIAKENTIVDRLDTVRKAIELNKENTVEASVASIVAQFNILKEDEEESIQPSSLFELIIDKMSPGIQISGFFYKIDKEGKKITVQGHARDRSSLISFTDELRKSTVFSKIDLPVSHLKKSKDISFSLSIFLP